MQQVLIHEILLRKTDLANLKSDGDRLDIDSLKNVPSKKIASNKTKHIPVENELKKLQTFDSSLFIGQNYFNNEGV